MPFSFIDIEEKKTRLLGFLFFFVILFYFLTAYLLLVILRNAFVSSEGFHWPGGFSVLAAFGVADDGKLTLIGVVRVAAGDGRVACAIDKSVK